jgi:hypothetical protein
MTTQSLFDADRVFERVRANEAGLRDGTIDPATAQATAAALVRDASWLPRDRRRLPGTLLAAATMERARTLRSAAVPDVLEETVWAQVCDGLAKILSLRGGE